MKKIIIILVIIAVAAVGTMYLIDSIKMKNGEEVVFGTWGKKYSTVVKTSQNENIIKEVKYSKTIGDTTIEINIPSGWNYKEMQVAEDDNYDYALKLYKNDEEQYAPKWSKEMQETAHLPNKLRLRSYDLHSSIIL